MIDYQKIAHDFPMLKRKINGKRLVFLDYASTTFKTKSVIDGVMNIFGNAHLILIVVISDCLWSWVRVDETRPLSRAFINAKKMKCF